MTNLNTILTEDDTFKKLLQLDYNTMNNRMEEVWETDKGYIDEPFTKKEIAALRSFGWTELEYKIAYREEMHKTGMSNVSWMPRMNKEIERLQALENDRR